MAKKDKKKKDKPILKKTNFIFEDFLEDEEKTSEFDSLIKEKVFELKKLKKTINKDLEDALKKIVNKIIKKDSRAEAMKLLKLALESEIGSFLYYYHSDMHNVCCMVIDSIKDRLHKEGKLPNRIGNSFGLFCKPGFIGNPN